MTQSPSRLPSNSNLNIISRNKAPVKIDKNYFSQLYSKQEKISKDELEGTDLFSLKNEFYPTNKIFSFCTPAQNPLDHSDYKPYFDTFKENPALCTHYMNYCAFPHLETKEKWQELIFSKFPQGNDKIKDKFCKFLKAAPMHRNQGWDIFRGIIITKSVKNIFAKIFEVDANSFHADIQFFDDIEKLQEKLTQLVHSDLKDLLLTKSSSEPENSQRGSTETKSPSTSPYTSSDSDDEVLTFELDNSEAHPHSHEGRKQAQERKNKAGAENEASNSQQELVTSTRYAPPKIEAISPDHVIWFNRITQEDLIPFIAKIPSKNKGSEKLRLAFYNFKFKLLDYINQNSETKRTILNYFTSIEELLNSCTSVQQQNEILNIIEKINKSLPKAENILLNGIFYSKVKIPFTDNDAYMFSIGSQYYKITSTRMLLTPRGTKKYKLEANN